MKRIKGAQGQRSAIKHFHMRIAGESARDKIGIAVAVDVADRHADCAAVSRSVRSKFGDKTTVGDAPHLNAPGGSPHGKYALGADDLGHRSRNNGNEVAI